MSDRAALTIALARLDRRNPAVDYISWQADTQTALARARAALLCSPLDGNLWAIQALLMRGAMVAPTQIAASLALSARLAPAESAALAARLQVWRSSPFLAGEPLDTLRRRDLATTLRYAYPPDVARYLNAPPPFLAAEMAPILGGLGPSRLDFLRGDGFSMEPASRDRASAR